MQDTEETVSGQEVGTGNAREHEHAKHLGVVYVSGGEVGMGSCGTHLAAAWVGQ